MKALELARLLMLYPEADVLIDTRGDKKQHRANTLKEKPFRQVDLKATVAASNDGAVSLVATDFGFWRAKT